MKIIFFLSLVLLSFKMVSGQSKTIQYFNDQWERTTAEKATYAAEFQQNGDIYDCTSYWIKTNIPYAISKFKDTTFANPVGLQKKYYESGKIQDSVYWKNDLYTFYYHYFPDGRLSAEWFIPKGEEKPVVNGYDENGKK